MEKRDEEKLISTQVYQFSGTLKMTLQGFVGVAAGMVKKFT